MLCSYRLKYLSRLLCPRPKYLEYMPIPDYQTLMLPALKSLADGAETPLAEVRARVAVTEGLTTEDVRELLPSGRQPVFTNRISWAVIYMKRAGLLKKVRRGVYRLTAEGERLLAQEPPRIDTELLGKYSGYVEWRVGKKNVRGTNEEPAPLEETADTSYRHATTNTGPGHAVVATGRHPSHSGIIDNDWFDRFLGAKVRVIDDPLYPPVGGPGDWASPARLDGFTLGDVLKVESPGSRVVAVSKKPRSAIMLAGRRGDAAYWYEQGRFITTSYYIDEAPTWLKRWNRSGRSDAWLAGTWTRVEAPELYETYAGADDVPGERTETDRTVPRGNTTAMSR